MGRDTKWQIVDAHDDNWMKTIDQLKDIFNYRSSRMGPWGVQNHDDAGGQERVDRKDLVSQYLRSTRCRGRTSQKFYTPRTECVQSVFHGSGTETFNEIPFICLRAVVSVLGPRERERDGSDTSNARRVLSRHAAATHFSKTFSCPSGRISTVICTVRDLFTANLVCVCVYVWERKRETTKRTARARRGTFIANKTLPME